MWKIRPFIASLSAFGLGAILLSSPNLQAEQSSTNPWEGLKVHNAPVLSYDGQSYFPISVERKGGGVRWEFVRDHDNPKQPKRQIVLSVLANTSVSRQEGKLLHSNPSIAAGRQVHQRNASHLQHSWWGSNSNHKTLHIVDWSMKGDDLYSCEILLNEGVGPTGNSWRPEFDRILRQAHPFLSESSNR